MRVIRSGGARRRRLHPGVAAALMLALMTTGVPAQGAETTVVPSDLLPASGALFGAYVNPLDAPYSPDSFQAQLDYREVQLGRRLDIHTLFFSFNDPLVDPMVIADIEAGRVPLISWGGMDTRLVRLGFFDPWIREEARSLRDLGGPVLVRWGWEMEAPRNEEWARAPWEFIRAWRRIVVLFAQEGAANVEFAWIPMAGSFYNGQPLRWYPGDQFVDWVGADGYNWSPGRQGFDWRSFHEIFAAFYIWAASTGKPIIIGETGVQERASGEKAAWLNSVDDTMIETFPEIDALCYFDTQGRWDWRIDTTESSLAAFTALAVNPYFNTRPV
jgi:hypothetical protein